MVWLAVRWSPGRVVRVQVHVKAILKELRHDISSHFFNNLKYGLSVGKPKNNGLPRKKNTKGVILKRKGTRTVEDGED